MSSRETEALSNAISGSLDSGGLSCQRGLIGPLVTSIVFVKRALAENPAVPISWQVSRSNSLSSTFSRGFSLEDQQGALGIGFGIHWEGCVDGE